MQPSPRLTSIRLSGSPSGVTRPSGVADVERRVRPGRLGQVLDRHRDPAVALDEQHVARLQHPAQRRDVGVGEGPDARRAARRACGRARRPSRSAKRVARRGHPRPPPRPSPATMPPATGRIPATRARILHRKAARRHLPGVRDRFSMLGVGARSMQRMPGATAGVTMAAARTNGDRMGPRRKRPARAARRPAAGGQPRRPARLRAPSCGR